MTSISLYSTSFLPPRNQNWSELEENNEILFADYGSWSKAFIEGDDIIGQTDVLVWIFFFEDLLSVNSTAEQILSPLQAYLNNNRKNIIVAYSKLALELFPAPESAKETPLEKQVAVDMENQLVKMRDHFSHLYLLSLDQTFSLYGYRQCIDLRNYYAVRCRLSSQGIRVTAKLLTSILNRMNYARKKVLLLDADNTLWGGVLGEVGLEGILLGQDGMGQIFQDFQKVIKVYGEKGILLAIVSKNDSKDVMNVLENHPGMVLKKDDFVSFKINWEDKFNNIKELSRELALGMDSFVFWDDSPIERDMVKTYIPEVTVIEPDKELSEWPMQLKLYDGFSQFKQSTEDSRKKEQYKIRAKFNIELDQQIDKTTYLKSIHMKPHNYTVDEGTIDRTFQLCSKTNQYNLRTVRHSLEDLRMMVKDKNFISLITRLEDDFGDYGFVGLFITYLIPNTKLAFLDTFLLSCRVIGRNLESWMLHEGIKELRKHQVEYLISEYIPTDKNGVINDFLGKHGFQSVNGLRNKLDIGILFSNTTISPERAVVVKLDKIRIPNLNIFGPE